MNYSHENEVVHKLKEEFSIYFDFLRFMCM